MANGMPANISAPQRVQDNSRLLDSITDTDSLIQQFATHSGRVDTLALAQHIQTLEGINQETAKLVLVDVMRALGAGKNPMDLYHFRQD